MLYHDNDIYHFTKARNDMIADFPLQSDEITYSFQNVNGASFWDEYITFYIELPLCLVMKLF